MFFDTSETAYLKLETAYPRFALWYRSYWLATIFHNDILPLSKNTCCISAASSILRWSVLSPSSAGTSTFFLAWAVEMQRLFLDRGSICLWATLYQAMNVPPTQLEWVLSNR